MRETIYFTKFRNETHLSSQEGPGCSAYRGLSLGFRGLGFRVPAEVLLHVTKPKKIQRRAAQVFGLGLWLDKTLEGDEAGLDLCMGFNAKKE